MTDMITDQRGFMYLGDQSTTMYNKEQISLYKGLIEEEVSELHNALNEEDKAEIIKEACDVLVVTLGLLLSTGIDVHRAWELVHKNNMSKVSNQDVIVKDKNGKIQKSEASKLAKQKMLEDIKGLLNVHSSQ